MLSRSSADTSNGMITTTGFLTISAIMMMATIAATRTISNKRDKNASEEQKTSSRDFNGTDNNNTEEKTAYESLVMDHPTPLIRLNKLSSIIHRNIYVKMENMNPSGTSKDRTVLGMILYAEKKGILPSPQQQQHCQNQPEKKKEEPEENNNEIKNNIDSKANNNNIDNNNTVSIYNSLLEKAYTNSKTGGIIIEGTSGSTGIALAIICKIRGHGCIVVMPDDQANEKIQILKTLGAIVHVVSNHSISHPNHYVNIAKHIHEQQQKQQTDTKRYALFLNQFENISNFRTHYLTTGPALYRQLIQIQKDNKHDTNNNNLIDAFVMSAGTGGTISGIGKYLKEKVSNNGKHHTTKKKQSGNSFKVVLVDPPGSVLYNKIKFGVAYTTQQKEQVIRRHRYDTIAEGIGLDRITNNVSIGINDNYNDDDYDIIDNTIVDDDIIYHNNNDDDDDDDDNDDDSSTTSSSSNNRYSSTNDNDSQKIIDTAIKVTDQEAIDMAHYVLDLEGLWMGSSSAMNLVGAIRIAKTLPKNSKIVTIICDHGSRHLTRFWNYNFITGKSTDNSSDSTSSCASDSNTTTNIDKNRNKNEEVGQQHQPQQPRWNYIWPSSQQQQRIPECVSAFLHDSNETS